MMRLLRPHAARLALGSACLAALASTSAAYAYLTGPVLQLLLSGGRSRPPLLELLPADWLPTHSPALTLVALLLVALALTKGLAHLGQVLLLEGTAERIGFELRCELYGHLLRLPLRAHRDHSPGDLLARLIDDVRQVQGAVVAAPIALVREGLSALALLAVAIATAPRLALWAALVLPIAALIISLLGRSIKRASARVQGQLGSLAARAGQGISAIREVKCCGAEARETARVEAHAGEALRWSVRHLLMRSLAPLINEVTAAAALGATLVYAGTQVSRGALAPDRFISFFAAVLLLYRPVKELGASVHQIAAGQASGERLRALLELAPEWIATPGADAQAAGARIPPLQRSLDLRGVSFRYRADAGWALAGVDLSLPLGRLVALAGPSGAGKTTLANLVCGLERPEAGRMLWDGVDLSAHSLSELRAHVALVPQQPLLLDGSLAENLRYGAPQSSDEELRQAVHAAGLDRLVADLRQGLNSPIGPGGIQLSVGEAQRLAIARALLRRASLLVLDEPSSALDAANERQLVSTLREVARARAVLVIAHRPELLAAADEVIELRDGRNVALPAQLRENVQRGPALQ